MPENFQELQQMKTYFGDFCSIQIPWFPQYVNFQEKLVPHFREKFYYLSKVLLSQSENRLSDKPNSNNNEELDNDSSDLDLKKINILNFYCILHYSYFFYNLKLFILRKRYLI